MYSKSEVEEATLDYFKGNELASNVWIDKYCLKDNQGNYLELTPDDMHKRSAKELARIELKYPNSLSEEEIYQLLKDFKYILLGGSVNYGIGNPYSYSSLGNCFVVSSNADSIGGIFTTLQEQAQLMKMRGGVGFDLSNYRSNGSSVNNAAKTSTGILSWEHLASEVTRSIAQSGRRGALLLSLDINHPDIEQFITSKDDLTKITGANISVKITDDFMKAVENDEEYILEFVNKHRSLFKPIKAKELWDKIIHQATTKAEPGCLFWDTITRESIPSCYGEEWKETSTNPCGEIPLCPYDSCRLLSVNLYSFVENPFTDKAYFNYVKFKDVVYKAQRLMDDIVDLEEEKINLILQKIENDPEPEEIKAIEKNLWLKIKQKLLEGRRTGLSCIGLADTFAALNITYGSSDSISLAEEIYKQFAISAYKSSIDMGRERGAFPIFNSYKERENPFIQRIRENIIPNIDWLRDKKILDRDTLLSMKRRNIALLTIPPSGSLSILAGISSGIEPVYQLYYKRRVKVTDDKPYDFVDATGDKWKEYIILHPKFDEWIISLYDNDNPLYWECYGLDINKLYKFEDSPLIPTDINILNKFMEKSPYYKSTSYEIYPIQRVKLQGAIQKWIDHSISSTINLKEGTSEETVSNIYMEAWKQGCKGITIYVNNSRTGVLVDTKHKENKFEYKDAPKRPKILDGEVRLVSVKGQEYLVAVGLLEGKPYEIMAGLNSWSIPKGTLPCYIIKEKGGIYRIEIKDILTIDNIITDMTDEQEAITRGYSYGLRHGGDVKFAVEQLNKTKGDLTSFSKAIARCLKRYIKDGEKSTIKCDKCGSELVFENGCSICKSCGNSKCS